MNKSFGLQWHITDLCDQRCKHCYIYSKNGETSRPELKLEDLRIILMNYLEMCERFRVAPYIFVTGGDPLLYYDIWGYLELLSNRKIPFSILGNPFHLTPGVCERLHRLGCQKYQMSLDGLQRTHDTIRKEGSFDNTLEKVPLLKDSGIKTAVMTTVSKHNILEIPELIKIVVDHHVDSYAFARYCPTHRDDYNLVTPEEYRGLLQQCWELFEKYKDRGTLFSLKDHLWIPFLHEKGVFQPEENKENLILEGCNCGISHMTILANGDVYACRRFESLIGNALSDSLERVFLGPQMEYYREYDKFEACSDCKYLCYCRGCPAVGYGLTGDFYGKDPQCWVAR
ncbi:radical SAM/SPASM domain protein, ACGX system [Diplocloster agilis]|uniref:Radical SAM/SPASM domain protein, ACGX system n=1 Tax=Diplocloster agilis TaxID=2850323 RepID=A0A949JZU3_9FIRM|nr:radical SAM/SPASM domain protein, ACGX system [Diplocloster agilis]MBU9738260.1 radical SAM/SPASM domain protein, ACGX system [Diplocloster agilis]